MEGALPRQNRPLAMLAAGAAQKGTKEWKEGWRGLTPGPLGSGPSPIGLWCSSKEPGEWE